MNDPALTKKKHGLVKVFRHKQLTENLRAAMPSSTLALLTSIGSAGITMYVREARNLDFHKVSLIYY